MISENQKRIIEEMNALFPKEKGNWEKNLDRCKYNALRLQGTSREEAISKIKG
jgi:hypothetical protein